MIITDISFLATESILDVELDLIIEPLAPLSMVTSMPGNFFRSQDSPSKHMVSGMFENIMGWWFSAIERKKIIESIQKKSPNIQFKKSNSGYQPLIEHLFELIPVYLPEVSRYCDYSSFQEKASDVRHINGSRNSDWSIESEMQELKDKENSIKNLTSNEEKKIASKEARQLAKKLLESGKFPYRYISPTKREFVIPKGNYLYTIKTTKTLADYLVYAVENNNDAYLGTSESLVNLVINRK